MLIAVKGCIQNAVNKAITFIITHKIYNIYCDALRVLSV